MHECTVTCNTVVPGSTVTGMPSTNTSTRLLAAAVAVVQTLGAEKKNHKRLITFETSSIFRDRIINYQPFLAIPKVLWLTTVF